jgi:hypothetical protein
MLTWLMGAWIAYHSIAALHYYSYSGAGAENALSLEAYFHQPLYVLNVGQYIGSAGPVFVITYGAIVTLVILIALYLEMGRTVRYALGQNFTGSQSDLYGSILLLVVCSVELFFVPMAATSLFVILLFAAAMDVLIHVRFLHHFVRRGK